MIKFNLNYHKGSMRYEISEKFIPSTKASHKDSKYSSLPGDHLMIYQKWQEICNNLNSDLPEPQIDIDMIEFIHHYSFQTNIERNGYVGFSSKIDGNFTELAGFSINELRDGITQISPYLSEDAYFTINSSYGTKPYKSSVTGLPAPLRKENTLRYLNACYCDIDPYVNNLTIEEAVWIVLEAENNNIIPPPSIIGTSGRGVYLYWMLDYHSDNNLQPAFTNDIIPYKVINKTIIDQLNTYNPKINVDKGAFDAARILRVPGSLHSGAGKQVKYLYQKDKHNRVYRYSIEYLLDFYCIDKSKHTILQNKFSNKIFKQAKNPGTAPDRKNGPVKSAKNRITDFLKIDVHQNGINKGKRYRSLYILSCFAKSAKYTKAEAIKLVSVVAGRSNPPYPSDNEDVSIKSIVNNAWSDNKLFRNDYLASFFEVTNQLADELNLISIIPADVKEIRNQEQRLCKKSNARREAIREIYNSQNGSKTGVRDIRDVLRKQNIIASSSTIKRDIHAINSSNQSINHS